MLTVLVIKNRIPFPPYPRVIKKTPAIVFPNKSLNIDKANISQTLNRNRNVKAQKCHTTKAVRLTAIENIMVCGYSG